MSTTLFDFRENLVNAPILPTDVTVAQGWAYDCIVQSRRASGAGPVRLGHVPGWFRRRLLAVWGCDRYCSSGASALSRAARINNWAWLDHWGTATVSGRLAFVSEPYGIRPRDFESIRQAARALDLAWQMSARSWWWPGVTIRVALWPRELREGSGS